MINTYHAGALVLLGKIVFVFSNFWNFNAYFTNLWTNNRHVCTYLNVFLMVIPNMVMKFHNFEIFYQFFYIFALSSALTCHVESIKTMYSHCLCSFPHNPHHQHCLVHSSSMLWMSHLYRLSIHSTFPLLDHWNRSMHGSQRGQL